jgi:hypothetical protein
MLIRLALATPIVLSALLIMALIPLSGEGTGTGLAEDQRPWVILIMAPSAALLSVYVSTIYASWLAGWHWFPAWVRALLFEPRRPNNSVPSMTHGLVPLAATLSPWARVRLAVGILVIGTLVVALSVPLYAILLLWLRRDFYEPLEAAMVGGAGSITAAWLLYLAYRYVRFGRGGARA